MGTSRNNKQNNFIFQAGTLAIAGIITRVIGLLYRSPLQAIIGDLGMGYYQSAYTFYTIVLLISSYSIPSALSKVIAQKLAVKEYKNAHKIFRCALVYVLVIGGVASIFLFFGASLFVEDAAVSVLRIFAPTIFVYGILGVLRGYFQAHKTMVQTSVSQILEQIINAIVSVGGAYLLIHTCHQSAEFAASEQGQVERAVQGAMGSAIGTGAGVAMALVFMLGMYALNYKIIHRRIRKDQHDNLLSNKEIFVMITAIVTPFILSTAVYNLSASVNTTIYTDWYAKFKDLGSIVINENWGIFSGKVLTITNIPIAFASAMASAMMPSVAQTMAQNNIKETRRKIALAVKTTMMIAIPCAFGIAVLAKPVLNLLFSNTQDALKLGGNLLVAMAVTVIFYALSTLNSSILQGIGKVNQPIINAGIALVLQTGVALGLLYFTELGLYAIVIANIVYSGLMCILNQRAVRRAVGYRQEYYKSFFIPIVSSIAMGIVCWGVYQLFYLITKSMNISLIPSILIAIIVYFVMLVTLKGVSEEELKGMPKGHLLVRLFRKTKILR